MNKRTKKPQEFEVCLTSTYELQVMMTITAKDEEEAKKIARERANDFEPVHKNTVDCTFDSVDLSLSDEIELTVEKI